MGVWRLWVLGIVVLRWVEGKGPEVNEWKVESGKRQMVLVEEYENEYLREIERTMSVIHKLSFHFNQPLYLRTRSQDMSSQIPIPLNRSHFNSELTNAFALSCNNLPNLNVESGENIIPNNNISYVRFAYQSGAIDEQSHLVRFILETAGNQMHLWNEALGNSSCRVVYAPRPFVLLGNYFGQELQFDHVVTHKNIVILPHTTHVVFSNNSRWNQEILGESSSSAAILQRQKQASFLETESRMRIVNKMLKPLVVGLLKPVVDHTVDHLQREMMPVLSHDIASVAMQEVAPDVGLMLSMALKQNLSAVLTDSIGYTLSKTLTISLTRSLGSYLSIHLSSKLIPKLRETLSKRIGERTESKLEVVIPNELDRALSLSLTHSLTRSLTHAIVSTLSHTITSQFDPNANAFCRSCYSHQIDCTLCPYSPERMRNSIYHSSYYSDYYSKYYAQYYVDALLQHDQQQRSASNATSHAFR